MPRTFVHPARAAACLALFLLATTTSVALAQQHDANCRHDALTGELGCGHARAAAARFLRERDVPVEGREPSPRSALSDTDVLHYDLTLDVLSVNTGSNSAQLNGTCVMTVRSLVNGLSDFTFRLRNQYTITSALINGVTPISVTSTSTTTRQATLDQAYDAGEEFTLTIAYNGASFSAGFGSIEVGTQGGTPVIATLSEPYYAYSWWPCKDGDTSQPGDNGDKFTIDLHITVPNNWVVPSNGILMGIDTLSGNRKRYHWSVINPISTYLVSFAATNYNTWTQTYNYPGGSMPVEFYIYPGNDNASNRTNWEKCITMMDKFRPFYGEYPFVNEKYGIYNFNFGGGMEHQTITGQTSFGESLTAHELGHQWWGDMVTCRTWRDIWLNEGFATYSECLWEEQKGVTPNLTAYRNAMLARLPSSSGAGDSVYIPEEQTLTVSRIFSTTYSYYKGAWVLHQLRHVVGDATFYNILANHRAAHLYSAATTDDFAAVASSTYGQDLTWFFEDRVKGAGAPNYQYGWQSTSVNGQNYLLLRINQTQGGVNPAFTMPIDVRATIGGSPQTLVAFNDAQTEWFVLPTSGAVTAVALDPDQWILRSGVTSTAYVAGPPKIVQSSPQPGEELTAPSPSQITLWMHTPVNVGGGTFTLVGDVNGAQPVTPAGASNVNPIVLNLGGPLPPDNYTLTISSGGVTAVNSGMTLDGELVDPTVPASLPSGDGIAGGDAVIQFTVVPGDIPGDIDQDNDIDGTDLQLLVSVLIGTETNPTYVQRSDLSGDLTANADDIQAFVNLYPAF